MEQRIYRFKYRLNILHSIGKQQAPHRHTLELYLHVEHSEESNILFENNDEFLATYFSYFENQYLNELPEFKKMLPTIENIGYLIFSDLKEKYKEQNTRLLKFEISEIPSRVYMISDFLDKGAEAEDISLAEKQLQEYVESYVPLVSFRMRDQENIKELKKIIEERKQKEAKEQEEIEELLAASKEKKSNVRWYEIVAALFEAFVLSFLMILATARTGVFPMGDDVYLYLGKADYLYQELAKGHIYPIFMDSWYNGYQMFMTSAPVPYVLLAVLQWLAGGDSMSAYLLLIGAVNFVSLLSFIMIGIRMRNFWPAVSFGLLWMFFPENLRAISVDGNVPYMVLMMLLPAVFALSQSALERRKGITYVGLAVVAALMLMTQPIYAVLFLCSILLVLYFYCRARQSFSGLKETVISIGLGLIASAPWLYQAIINGTFGAISFSTQNFSFGIVPFCAICFLALFAQKESRKCIAGAICLMLLSQGVYFETLQGTTVGTLIFNPAYATVAYLVLGIAFILWENGKKRVKFAFWLVLLLGCVPGTYHLIKNSTGQSIYEQQVEIAKENGLTAAMEQTDRRMILLGLGEELSFPAYFAQTNGIQINFSYDLTNHGAVIGENLEMLNYALYSNNFSYLFDRCLVLGNDTVVIKKEGLEWQEERKEELRKQLLSSAESVGYTLASEDEYSYVFYMELPEYPGVVSKYEGIAIGENSSAVALIYPIFHEGYFDNIEDYTLEELLDYRLVFLSGFRYNNKEEAEELVRQLSNHGIKVYIDMNGVPENVATNRKTFLGVTAQDITFWDKYPNLIFDNKVYELNKFYKEYSNWGTVYIQNAEPLGYTWVDNKPICFFGKSEGVYFIGFEILAHVLESDDSIARELLKQMFLETPGELPEHEIYPISYTYDGSKIQIVSGADQVNTTLAYQTSFLTESEVEREQNMLVVNEGITTITFSYRNIMIGFGILTVELLAVLVLLLKRKQEVPV